MSRTCCCTLVLVWFVMQTQLMAKPLLGQGLRHVIERELVATAMSVLLVSGVAVASDFQLDAPQGKPLLAGEDEQALSDEEIEQHWHQVRHNPPSHYQAVFYLLLDMFNIGKRLMHVEFVGYHEDEPLFVGPRHYLLSGEKKNGKPQFILRWAQASLVGHHGLLGQNVEIEEVTYFRHPVNDAYDQTLLVIKGVNLNRYKPLRLATYPEPDTSLMMLSYSCQAK